MKKTMRYGWVLAAVALATASGFRLHPASATAPSAGASPGLGVAPGAEGDTLPAGPSLAAVTLPDLDQDGKAEVLHVDAAGQGKALIRLKASAGRFTHRVLELAPSPATLTVRGQAPHWTMVDEHGLTRVSLWVIPGEGQVAPDLVAVTQDMGRRYRFVERGFLKLDAQTVIPGYSVGLVALGDSPRLLEALGGKPAPDGTWVPPVPARTPLTLSFGSTGRVQAIAYSSPALTATNGVRPGASLLELTQRFPGRLEGGRWLSARYGLKALMDPQGHARTLEVQQPWPDPEANAASTPKAKGG